MAAPLQDASLIGCPSAPPTGPSHDAQISLSRHKPLMCCGTGPRCSLCDLLQMPLRQDTSSLRAPDPSLTASAMPMTLRSSLTGGGQAVHNGLDPERGWASVSGRMSVLGRGSRGGCEQMTRGGGVFIQVTLRNGFPQLAI